MNSIPSILDTDIGDDIDDVFCLALALRCPEIDLRAVTTSMGRTAERAEIVRDLCNQANRRPEIAAGFTTTMGSQPVEEWLTRLYYPFEPKTGEFKADAPEVLRLISQLPAEGILFTIGTMTNAAAAVMARDRSKSFPRIIAMAGEFQRYGHIEFNIRCDPEAANVCFTSGLRVDLIPWSIGPATKLLPADIAALRAATSPLARRVVYYLERFWKIVPNKTNMYDPMTVVAALHPELFEWKRGTVKVELAGRNTYGLTTFHAHDDGPHRIAWDVKADEAKAFLVQRLCQ